MTISNSTKGVWVQNDITKKINLGRWITYDPSLDPTKLMLFGSLSQFGESGSNLRAVDVSSPLQIPGTNWNQVDGGADYAGAIKSDGTLWLWGRNTDGQLATGDFANRSSPVQVPGSNWCLLSTGKQSANNLTYAIKDDNTLWAWGSNNNGEMGINSTSSLCYSTPVQIPGTSWKCVVGGINNHLALRHDNTLWTWGVNVDGATGLNNTTNHSSPVQLPGTWVTMSTLCAGGAAIKSDNTLWMWGNNNTGVLGQETRVHRSSPVQVPGTNWCQVSSTENNIAAIRTDGTLWTWGQNNFGQLGINTRQAKSSPTQIPGTTWCKVSMSHNRTIAEKTDKTLWMWGADTLVPEGELVNRSSPVQISGDTWLDFNVGRSVNIMVGY